MTDCEKAMRAFGIDPASAQILTQKAGITVARATVDGKSVICKHFALDEDRRELENYRLLADLGVPTIRVLGTRADALLLEDIAESPVWRMGEESDMDDPAVAAALAAWYRALHRKGAAYVKTAGAGLYDESDCFTRENLTAIAAKTATQDAETWQLLTEHFDALAQKLRQTPRTLTYNDFYHTNLVVSRDGERAMMFDYNLLGKGYAYADLRNVTSSLSPRAAEAFLAAYGAFDPAEAALDDVVSPIVTLHYACRREHFPNWARSSLESVRTDLPAKIRALLAR